MSNFLHQPGGLHMVLNGQAVQVAKDDKCYAAVVAAVMNRLDDNAVLAIVGRNKVRTAKAVEVVPGVILDGGQLHYEGAPIAGVLGDRMQKMLDECFDLASLSAFLNNLLQNPSRRVVEHLYGFLETGKCPITNDGHFLAYKAIRENWKDIYTGNFDNSIGAVLSMPRHRVDEDPHRMCSHGFHVCSFDYLPRYVHVNGHVVVCKVNPADVVALPVDYNDTQMRVTGYVVMAECEGYYKRPLDAPAPATIRTEATTEPFVVKADCSEHCVYGQAPSHDSLRVTGAVLDGQPFDVKGGDSSFEEAETFSLWGVRANAIVPLREGFTSVADAVIAALHDVASFDSLRVLDREGKVMQTIT